jgi:hypothetical protein
MYDLEGELTGLCVMYLMSLRLPFVFPVFHVIVNLFHGASVI